ITENHRRLIILREKRDHGSLELLLEKHAFRVHHVPVFKYDFVFPSKLPPDSRALLFSSRAGVRAVASLVSQMDNLHCVVIGEETQNALCAAGFQGHIERFLTIGAFLNYLSQKKRKEMKSIHYYRGDVIKNPNLGQMISELGYGYSETIVYKTSLIKKIPQDIRALIQDAKQGMGYVALSPRGMGHWDDLIFFDCLAHLYRKGHLFCLSKDVASRSKIMPQSSITVPSEPTTTSLIASIEAYYKRSP
ncbi:MAG: uroporphyrinogen-III synthase, partial [Alphaproteobacteria bacterium]